MNKMTAYDDFSLDEKKIRSERDGLIQFCNEHCSIYLYGAGDFAKHYFRILQSIGTKPIGCIVSNTREEDERIGIPVWQASCIRDLLPENCGVIGAFDGATVAFLKNMLGEQVDCFALNREVLLDWMNELVVNPILHELSRKHPVEHLSEMNLSWENVLVIRLDAVGDMILTTAFLREVKRNFPDASITLVIHEKNVELFDNCPFISRLILYSYEPMKGHISEQFLQMDTIRKHVLKFCNDKLGKEFFDAVFLPRELLSGRTAASEFLMASYCKARYRMGRMRNVDLSQRRLYKIVKNMFSILCYQATPMHEVNYMLDFLKACGGCINNTNMELWPKNVELSAAMDFFQTNGISGGKRIAVGVAAADDTRTWNFKYYRELIMRINYTYPFPVQFILFGDSSSSASGHGIAANLPNIVDLTGRTNLSQALAYMKMCHMYIGSNTGLLHMAAALGKPVVEISATLPDVKKTDGNSSFRMGPWGVPSILLQPLNGLDGCHEFCKKKYSHCINQIQVDDVFSAVEKCLSMFVETGR